MFDYRMVILKTLYNDPQHLVQYSIFSFQGAHVEISYSLEIWK